MDILHVQILEYDIEMMSDYLTGTFERAPLPSKTAGDKLAIFFFTENRVLRRQFI